jgi:hypothetical protein
MAFLDDLKKQAELQRQQEQTETQSKLVAVSQNFLLVQTKYKEIQRYLQELVNQLNVLNMDITRPYFIDGFGLIDDFRPRDYALNIDSIRIGQKDFINALVLRFRCVTDKAITIERTTPQQIDNQRDYLWQNNLKYQCQEFKNERGLTARAVFTVASEVPVTAKFSADFESAKIMLQFKNLNGLTVNDFIYDAKEINQELLDEFAKFLLDQPNKLRELGLHQLARRTTIRPAQAHKDIHYPNANAVPEDQDEDDESDDAGGKKGFFGTIRSLLS